jgi:hypothetical protein
MRTVIALIGVLLAASDAAAQTLTPRLLGQVSGKREETSGEFRRMAQDPANDSGLSLLSQADVAVESQTTQVGLQAMDLFFDKDWRLYVRSTLPVPDGNDETAAAESATALNASTKSALVDPYGGVLNLSVGAFKHIPSVLTPRDGNGVDPDHGIFLDARFGLKLINLPDQTADSPALLNTTVSPFYSAAVMFKIVRSIFPSEDSREAAGGFEFGIGGIVNIAADKSASKAFSDGRLETTTGAVRCDVALSLTSIAAINVSWTPWSNNDAFGKRFVIGLKLLNQNPAVK